MQTHVQVPLGDVVRMARICELAQLALLADRDKSRELQLLLQQVDLKPIVEKYSGGS